MMDLAISNSQLVSLAGLIAICLFLGRFKLGLLILFCCAFCWYFIDQRDLFFVNLETSSSYVLLFFVSGVVLVACTLFSFLTSE